MNGGSLKGIKGEMKIKHRLGFQEQTKPQYCEIWKFGPI